MRGYLSNTYTNWYSNSLLDLYAGGTMISLDRKGTKTNWNATKRNEFISIRLLSYETVAIVGTLKVRFERKYRMQLIPPIFTMAFQVAGKRYLLPGYTFRADNTTVLNSRVGARASDRGTRIYLTQFASTTSASTKAEVRILCHLGHGNNFVSSSRHGYYAPFSLLTYVERIFFSRLVRMRAQQCQVSLLCATLTLLDIVFFFFFSPFWHDKSTLWQAFPSLKYAFYATRSFVRMENVIFPRRV